MDKLKERIDKMFKTRAEFADAIGVTPSTLSRTLSSGNWDVAKLKKAVEVLKIPARDIPLYFFPSDVAIDATNEVEK